MYKKLLMRSLVSFGLLSSLMTFTMAAEEMAAGTVISKSNFDEVKNKLFEGKRVGDMIPERVEWMIRERELTMKIRHSEKIEMDEKYMKATQDGKGKVKFDPATRQASGWTAGMFFDPQDIDINDPYAGDKIIWNLRGPTYGSTMDLANISFVFIDGEDGVERIQRWASMRYYMEGRLDGGPVQEGDGNIMQKTILVATSPQDIKGLGTFSIRYNDASAQKSDDTWAYLKSVRRVRRLTGSAWMDPIGGTVQLYDDWDIWDAVPTKYKSTKLLETRWIFAIAHSPEVSVDLSKKGTPEEFPSVGLEDAPYYYPGKQIEWEPREVFVVEGTPPEGHPYSKKIVYMEKDFPRPYLGEAYDQNGKFWKFMIFQNRPDIGDDGYKAVMPVVGHVIDYKANFSTTWSANMNANPEGVEANDVTLKQLIKLAR
ncbi:outer membrane lipoprotein-sorting protein [Thalassotalea sp. 42_200_T64]|nr:outer membrane lipoprotein-sorting protein [Thalassotalea sp. 42_200_T64]